MRATASVFIGRQGILLDFDVFMADGSCRRVTVHQQDYLQHHNEGVMRQAEQAIEPIITVNANEAQQEASAAQMADMKDHHPIQAVEPWGSSAIEQPEVTAAQQQLNQLALNQLAPARPKGRQGFASMDKAKHRTIASQGGKAAHEKGTGHEWTREEAKIYGAMGGRAKKKNQ